MPQPDFGSDIARSLDAMSRNVKKAVREVSKGAAKVGREEHTKTAKAATGGDGRYSNFKGPALTVKAKYDDAGVSIIPAGPWKIAEEGADAHTIKPKRGKALKFASGDVRSVTVKHPGTKGSRAWSRAEDATVARLDKTVPETFDRAVADGF